MDSATRIDTANDCLDIVLEKCGNDTALASKIVSKMYTKVRKLLKE